MFLLSYALSLSIPFMIFEIGKQFLSIHGLRVIIRVGLPYLCVTTPSKDGYEFPPKVIVYLLHWRLQENQNPRINFID